MSPDTPVRPGLRPPRLKTLLALLLGALFLLQAAVLLTASVRHTRAYLQTQLQNHAQDAATTLAMQLGPVLAANDQAGMENIVDTLNDSGYYQRIRLARMDNSTLLERSSPVRVEQVPDWFIRLLPLETPSGRAEAQTGWRMLAAVEVTSHPGHAYAQLWHSTVDIVLWTLFIFVLSVTLGVQLLRITLKPLAAMEHMARRICARRFERIDITPRVLELVNISAAMNQLSGTVEGMLKDQTQLIENLRHELYTDRPTGLFNRDFLVSRAEAALAEPGKRVGLVFMQIGDMDALNARLGRGVGDEIMQAAARAAATLAAECGGHAARLDGGQIALLLENAEAAALERHAGQLAGAVQTQLRDAQADSLCAVHVGAAIAEGEARSTLFAMADAALSDAQLGASGTYRLATARAPGGQDVRVALLEALERQNIRLEWQPVVHAQTGNADHHEAYARIDGADGHTLPTGAVARLAEEAGLASRMDRQVLDKALLELDTTPASTLLATLSGTLHGRPPRDEAAIGGALSVNMASVSLEDAEFTAWLLKTLPRQRRIQLEFSLQALLDNPAALAAAAHLRQAGVGLVLDRFVPDNRGLELLRELLPAVVKVEATLCRQACADLSARVMLETLCTHAHALGVRVGASGVERDAERDALRQIGFDLLQGHLIGAPGPL